MIYKFECREESNEMEVALFNDENQSKELKEVVTFSINESDNWYSCSLNKKDIYHLIGALHLLHKEMK